MWGHRRTRLWFEMLTRMLYEQTERKETCQSAYGVSSSVFSSRSNKRKIFFFFFFSPPSMPRSSPNEHLSLNFASLLSRFSWFLYCSFSLQFFFSFKNETSVSYLGFLLLFTFLFYFRVLFMHTCLEASPRCVSISTWLHFFTNRIVDRSHEKQNIHSRYQPRNSMNNKLIEHFPLMMVSVILDTQSVSVIVVNIASSGALTHLSG